LIKDGKLDATQLVEDGRTASQFIYRVLLINTVKVGFKSMNQLALVSQKFSFKMINIHNSQSLSLVNISETLVFVGDLGYR
jgi:hypothetical protein